MSKLITRLHNDNVNKFEITDKYSFSDSMSLVLSLVTYSSFAGLRWVVSAETLYLHFHSYID